jgi:hypothetical protein
VSQPIRVAISLALAIILSIGFAVVFFHGLETSAPAPLAEGARAALSDRGASAPGEGSAARSPPAAGAPLGPPEAPDQAPSKERFPDRGDGLDRWNLGELPEGWDTDLARSIHGSFELMDDYEQALRAGGSGAKIDAARGEFRRFLASLGPEALPTLSTILHHEPDFVYRRFLLEAIGGLGPQTEAATWTLRDYFMARRDDPVNRSEVGYVIKAMEKLQNDTSFSMLQGLVRDPGSAAYRDKLIAALGEHPRRDEASGFLVDGLRKETSKRNRNRYAQALGKVADPETLPDLFDAFQRETYWVNKQTILGSIGKIGDPQSIPFLEEQARFAQESAVRLAAGKALSRIGGPGLDTLRSLAASEPQPELRHYFEKWSRGEE